MKCNIARNMFLWIKSYLHNRRARVVIDNTKSKNECTCSCILPWTLMLHVGICEAFENTMAKDFALFKCRPFSSLFVTTTLIKRCNYSSDSAMITISSAYIRLFTTVPPILKPSMSSCPLIIISVYNANK